MSSVRNGRWIILATILGSGAVFLEGTVVNVALPAIGHDLALGVAQLQWILSGYLVTLGALMLLGGALGDRYRRADVFALGLLGFAIATGACALAPNLAVLLACRVLQGAAGALAVPNSLALLETTFHGEARGAAIGQWAAWSAVSTAAGPLAGGLLVDAVGWRAVFAVVVPLALAAAWLTWRHARGAERVPDASDDAPLDVLGALLATVALAASVVSLTTSRRVAFGAVALGAALLLAVVERRAARPLLPARLFRERAFVGANAVTLVVYAALSGLLFLLMLELQDGLGYSALAAGASMLPVNALMLVLSPRAGKLAERIGHRVPIAVGAFVAGLGMLLFARVQPGAHYATSVLPAALVFGLGLSCFVAPISAAALRAAPDRDAGIASAVNNAVSRLAGLVAIAVLPVLAGIGGLADPHGAALAAGFARTMYMCAALCVLGALLALLMLSGSNHEGHEGHEDRRV